MNLIPGARLTSESAIYLTLLLIFPLVLPWELMAGTVLLCALGCSLAGLVSGKTGLRILCILLPLLSLAIPAANMQRLCMLPIIAYSVLLTAVNRVYADPWNYARHIKVTLPFELLLLIVGCTLRTERALQLLALGNLYFIFGVYYMHQLRLGGGVSLRGRLRDLGSISILPLGAGAIVGLIAVGLKPIGKAVLGFVTMIGMAMRYVVELCTGLYHNPKVDVVKVTLAATEATEATVETTTEGYYPETWPEIELTPEVFRAIVIAAALALLGLLLYGVYRFQRRPAAGRGEQHWAEAESFATELPARERNRITSNRRRVRKAYMTYLRLLQGKGFLRRSADTSQDVLDASLPYTDGVKGNALRQIYIRARYRMDTPVSDEDVQNANTLLREIRKNSK